MEQDNTYIRFDWAMKHMLRDKANFGILEGLISVLTGETVQIVEMLESESNQESADDMFNRVDVKARNCKGHLIIVEVQLTRQLYYLQRILYGTCKAITEHMSIGDKYDQVKKVYSISILYCDFGQGDDYVYHGMTRFKGLHSGSDLVVSIREEGVIIPHYPHKVFPEYYIVRVNAYNKVPESPLDEWMTYLKTGKVREDTDVPGLQEVKRKLQYLAMSPKERRAYDAYMDNIMVQNDVLDTAHEEGRAEGLEEGLARGLEQGLNRGREEGQMMERLAMARKMHEAGISIEQITALTGIDRNKIE